MFSLFNPNKIGSRGTLETPALDVLIKKQRKQIESAKSWYRSNPVYVNSGSWISQLVYDLVWENVTEPTQCYKKALETHSEICLVNGIADSVHDPRLITDEFCIEKTVVCATLESRRTTNLPNSVRNWHLLSPIKVLYRPGIEGALQLPVSKLNNGPGYMLLGVDVPMLALMVNAFIKLQPTLPIPDREDIADLIAKYIVPNMLDSQMNCIMLNAMNDDDYTYKWRDYVPFSHADQSLEIGIKLNEFILDTADKSMLIDDIADSIPSLNLSMSDTIFTFGLPTTTNSHWFKIISGLLLAKAIIPNVLLTSDNEGLFGKVDRMKRLVRSYRTWTKIKDKELGKYFGEQYDDFIKKIEE